MEMELDITTLIKAAMNRQPKFVPDPDWKLINKDGETRPHIIVETPESEPFFRVYINLIGELFKVKSLVARNLLLWMMKEAQPDTNRVYLYSDGQERAREEIGAGQAQLYASLKTLEEQGLIYKVRRGIWEVNPGVMFNGKEINRKLMEGTWKARVTIEAVEVKKSSFGRDTRSL